MERNENRKLPEPILDVTPEQLALALMQGPPKKEWQFQKHRDAEGVADDTGVNLEGKAEQTRDTDE